MYLTENYLIFSKKDKEIPKRWQIAIPLSSVILQVDSEEKGRRKILCAGADIRYVVNIDPIEAER